jgi:hypothetical protein
VRRGTIAYTDATMNARLTTIRLLPALTFATALAAAGPARADVYVCANEQGQKTYTDSPGRTCRRLDLPAATTLPAPRPQGAAARPAKKGQDGPDTAAAAAPPAGFPRVDNATQKARDADRRSILEQELRAETEKLAALRKEYNNGEPERRGDERNYAKYQERTAQMKGDLNRAQQNVEALTRELANQR